MKIYGVICYYKKNNEKNAHLGIICSDSVFRKVFVYFNEFKYDLGVYIFGELYEKNKILFLRVEEVSFNFGYFYWNNPEKLKNLRKFFEISVKFLPENIFIENLYFNLKLGLENLDEDGLNRWEIFCKSRLFF